MVYDRGDSFPLDFEPNRIPFGSKSKGKMSPRKDPIQFERKWNTSFLSVSAILERVRNRNKNPDPIEDEDINLYIK